MIGKCIKFAAGSLVRVPGEVPSLEEAITMVVDDSSGSRSTLGELSSSTATDGAIPNDLRAGAANDLKNEGEQQQPQEEQQELNRDGSAMLPLHKLFAFADGYDYFLMGLGTLGAIGHGFSMPTFFYFFGKLVHDFGSYDQNADAKYHDVTKRVIFFVYVGAALFVSSWLEIACWIQTAERQTTKLRVRYLQAILQQDICYFDVDARTGEIVNSISANPVIIQQAMGEKVGNFIHHMSTFVSGIGLGFINVWQLGLVTLSLVPAIAIVGGVYAYIFTTVTSRSLQAYGKAGNVVQEFISQVRTVYSFTGEEKAKKAFSQELDSTLPLGFRASLAKGLGVGVLYAISLCAWALLLWYGGVLIRNGKANGGQVLSTIFCVIIGGFGLGQSAPSIAAISKARASAMEIMNMIKAEPQINKTSGKCLETVRGNIELRDVSFCYPSRPGSFVFIDFNLKIPAANSIAIVGQSGSGKSTVISLIERFYDPTSGAVLLDDHDIRTLQLQWLRSQIGLVNQEPALFDTSIEENILYGKEDANLEELLRASRAANAHDFISQLPAGYKTRAGSRGIQLSGGQKQRIAIARALLKNPTIVLLDEATSALDGESERAVQEAIDRIMVGRTTVIVAHRLSTIKNANSIAVLEHGKLVEQGTHDELVSRDGVYSALIHLQHSRPSDTSVSLARISRSRSSSRSASFRKSIEDKHGSGRMSISKLKILSFTSREEDDDDFYSEITGDSKTKHTGPMLWRLVKLGRSEMHYILLGILAGIASGLPNPLYGLLISNIAKVFYLQNYGHMRVEIEKYALLIVLVAGGTVIVFTAHQYFFGVAGEILTKRVREMMLSAILRNEISWFDQEENGSLQLTARLSTDAVYVKTICADVLATLTQNLSIIGTSFLIAFVVEWRLALVVAATYPLIVAAMFLEKFMLRGVAGDMKKCYSQACALAGEAVSNIRTVAAFNAESKLVTMVERELQLPNKQSFIRGNIIGAIYGLSSFCLFGSYGLGLWYGAHLIKSGKAEFSGVVKSFTVLIIAAFAIGESMALVPDMTRVGKALGSVFAILDRQTLIDPDSGSLSSIRNIRDSENASAVLKVRGDIEFREVVFTYPSRPDVVIFSGLNLKVKQGKSMAVVGQSGSGKSTIVALVERFYDPSSGSVCVDGRDIRKLNLKAYRRSIGLVQQEPALFATSILENIAYGNIRESYSEEEIVAAAKAANAHEFICGLPEGYKTLVGERGVQLSGGQKQRVAIARVVLKDPTILLLDEATSALDAQSERVVQEALDKLMKRKSSIVVAHRLSTVRNVDQIAVLHEGQVVEQGTHKELVDKPDGAYAKLVAVHRV